MLNTPQKKRLQKQRMAVF